MDSFQCDQNDTDRSVSFSFIYELFYMCHTLYTKQHTQLSQLCMKNYKPVKAPIQQPHVSFLELFLYVVSSSCTGILLWVLPHLKALTLINCSFLLWFALSDLIGLKYLWLIVGSRNNTHHGPQLQLNFVFVKQKNTTEDVRVFMSVFPQQKHLTNRERMTSCSLMIS